MPKTKQHCGWFSGIHCRATGMRTLAGCTKGELATGNERSCRSGSTRPHGRAGLLYFVCTLAATGIALPPAPAGRNPYAGVIRDSAGNLYGTTTAGGASDLGVVYKLDTAGHETVLHSFTGDPNDGASPQAGVIRDSAGNLYGTTFLGGTNSNNGVVYKLDAAGHETLLYSFVRFVDGQNPYAGVIRDSAGNLYGTTQHGGGGAGTLYMLDASGQETVLYSFTGDAHPIQGVIGSAGSFYGVTGSGGPRDAGLVYRLDKAGFTVLYVFTGGADGGYNHGGVIRDSAGNLYGASWGGGNTNVNCAWGGCGVVYKLDKTGQETVLYSFTGGTDGALPQSGVIRDSAGNLYGTTFQGGITNANCPAGCGVVYKVNATGQETVLYSFTGGADGGYPYAGVIRDLAGNLLRDYEQRRHIGGLWRRVQAGYSRPRDGALQLQRSGERGRGQPLAGCDAGLGRQPLLDLLTTAAAQTGGRIELPEAATAG